MGKRYGIVYMGSKEKILSLISYMFDREINKSFFVDLFCGGFSVSSYALQTTKFDVISNDLNENVIALYEEILSGSKNLDLVKTDWISRERFQEIKEFPEFFPKWYVGYILNTWTFGGNQKDYIYAKDMEENKKAIHYALVNNDFSLLDSNSLFKRFKVPEYIRQAKYSKDKRIAFMSEYKKFCKARQGTSYYEEVNRLNQLVHLSLIEHFECIANNIPRANRLMLYQTDWKEALKKIPNEVLAKSFIYCDPPYENTKQYLVGSDFDYVEFWNWFRTCPYSVYVSSYTAPADINIINNVDKQVKLDHGNKTTGRVGEKLVATENLYWNGKGEVAENLYDMLFNK